MVGFAVSIPAHYVPAFPYGTRVRWRIAPTPRFPAGREGEGVFELHWMGAEECWNVRLDNGDPVLHLFPCFGDTMEAV